MPTIAIPKHIPDHWRKTAAKHPDGAEAGARDMWRQAIENASPYQLDDIGEVDRPLR
jgi:hypothetical protein